MEQRVKRDRPIDPATIRNDQKISFIRVSGNETIQSYNRLRRIINPFRSGRRDPNMSIRLEFLNIVIPIASLKKCPSIRDVSNFLAEQTYPGSGCWHDEHLYREGTMNNMDLMLALARWKEMGLKPKRRRKGVEEWHELCVVDTFSGPTLPCRWLEYNPESMTASMMASQCTDVSPKLRIALDSLEQSPLFQLSLASKELFHSNFIAWCCKVWPEQTGDAWSTLAPGLFNNSQPETVKSVCREHNNHDIEIRFNNDQLLVVELKVKSLASEKQLREYASNMKQKSGPKPRLVLVSLIEPDFLKKKGDIPELENEIDCSWVDLSNMASALNNCLKGQPPSGAQFKDSTPGYLDALLDDYKKFVEALKVVTSEAAKVEADECFFLRKADRDAITDLRLHDLVFKLRYQQLCEKVQGCLPANPKFWIKAEMSNGTGMITVDFNLGNMDPAGYIGKLGIGIQLQEDMCRQYFSSSKKNGGIGKKLLEICNRLRDKNLWLNDYKLVDDMSTISTMRNKDDYCKYDDVFFYNYRNLKEDISATKIINYISEKMVYLQSKEKEIIDIVNAIQETA